MRGPKQKPDIICPRCNRLSKPVRGYCKNCASTLLRKGELDKIQIDNTPRQLTETQESILNGLMLGDGCLFRLKETHKPYLTVIRKQDDRDYLVENYLMFKDFCKRQVIDGEVFDKRTGHTTFFSRFVTRRCGVFESYYKKWYPNGKKCVPLDLVLNPLTMAIWFADDGYARTTCSPWRFRIQLSTDGFSYENVCWLKLKLEKLCCAKLFITGRESYRLNLSDVAARAFIKIIDEYLPKSMQRKKIWTKENSKYY